MLFGTRSSDVQCKRCLDKEYLAKNSQSHSFKSSTEKWCDLSAVVNYKWICTNTNKLYSMNFCVFICLT